MTVSDTTVSVVIPSGGLSERLRRCLNALVSQTLKPCEIAVVSSGINPNDGLMARWPNTQVVVCPSTASFAQAVNLGIATTSGAWVLLLNDDVVLQPSFLEQLLKRISVDERIGMACGKLLAADGRTIDSTGQFVSRARTASERGHRTVDRGQFDKPSYVFSAPGAAALYRRDMLEAMAIRDHQYFDEKLGMYLEDLDLGWRAQRAGWRAYYVPEACATHVRGATAKSRQPRWPWLRRYYLPWLSPELQARYIINRYKLIAKHDSWRSLLRNLPWILWYEARLWAYLLWFERKTLRLVLRALLHDTGVRPVVDFLAFYHVKPWEHKTSGLRGLLYVFLAYAMSGQWAWLPMLLNTVAALGVLMFAAAFDDYWDSRVRAERNVLTLHVAAGSLSPGQALLLSCAPLLLTLPVLGLAPMLGLPLQAIGLVLAAGVVLLVGYSVPPIRLKEQAPWGFFVCPVLASLLFLESWRLLTPLTLFAMLFAIFLFIFQCYAEAMHVIDNVLCGRAIRTVSFTTAVSLFHRLPVISLVASLGFTLLSPLYLITAGCSAIRWLAVRRLDFGRLHRIRRQLWNPVWSLYEFVAYACAGIFRLAA